MFSMCLKLMLKPYQQQNTKKLCISSMVVKKVPWPPVPPVSEQDLVLLLASHILKPLCKSNEVVLENRYREILTNNPTPEITFNNIGIGSLKTWHGTPDVRVRGTYFLNSNLEDDAEDDSDGATSTFEAKLKYTDSNLPQAVATCVTASFTQKNIHLVCQESYIHIPDFAMENL